MVQRKVATENKLGIQADHVKSEKRLANQLKPSSSQYQEGKNNRAADFKKKIKKSRNMKISDVESLRSSPVKRNLPLPGKPPPSLHVPTTTAPAPAPAAIPQKLSPIKSSEKLPNYMKATSSSDARKERSQSQVSTQTRSGSNKSLHQRNTKHSSSSGNNKSARTLTRSSSLELVRTLTKTPSFKPARASANKCSKAALCADMDMQRATCSSTLKDSKFPNYLALSPGATESKGTSAMKVCPYTYCSLNGHHHPPLPPLKCFLKAKRRLLKTQKSTKKMEAPGACRAKLSGDKTKENVTGQVIIDEKPGYKEADAGMDFYIEIYAKSKEDSAEANGSSILGKDEGTIDFVGASEDHSGQVAENLSDGSPQSEIDFEESLAEYCAFPSTEMDNTGSCPGEEQKAEDADEEYPPNLAQEDATLESFGFDSDFEGEFRVSMEADDTNADSEATDMEWDEGEFSTPELENGVLYSIQIDIISDLKFGFSPKFESPDLQDELMVTSDACSCNEDALVDEVLQEVIEEARGCFEIQFDDSDFELEEKQEKNGDSEAKNVIPEADPQLEDANASDGALDNQQENKSLQNGETDTWLGNQICDASQGFTEDEGMQKNEETEGHQINQEQELANAAAGDGIEDKDEVAEAKLLVGVQVSSSTQGSPEADQETNKVDDVGRQETVECCQLVDEDSYSSQVTGDDSFCAGQGDKAAGQDESINIVENQSVLEDELELNKFKNSSSFGYEEQTDSRMNKSSSGEYCDGEVDEMEAQDNHDSAETFPAANNTAIPEFKGTFFQRGENSSQAQLDTCSTRKWTIGSRKTIGDCEEEREFNPREPNYLPVVPDPEAEKVDLRHQMLDERKNADEWMLDHALQQAVTKLAPARKRKVALLVEAFETVLPVPKYEPHMRHPSAAFTHPRPIQACN